jgi:LysR family transcriptional activator of nhaA
MAGVSEQIYAISNERRIRHPAIEVLCSSSPSLPGTSALPEDPRGQAAPPQV